MSKQIQMNQAPHLLAAVLLLTALLALPAHSESTLVFTVDPADGERGPAGRIYCGPDPVMTLAGRGWESVTDAEEVARRLNALAEEGIRPNDIAVQRQPSGPTITARGRTIVLVHPRMARFHRSDPRRLAQTWADNLQSQFAKPYLSLAPILVPVGENRIHPVRGNIVGELDVRAQAPIVTTSYDPARKLLRVFGSQAGHTELILSDSQSSLHVPIRSAKRAAHIPPSLTGAVTGDPAPPTIIARAAEAAAKAALQLEPGAWASIRPAARIPASLPAGRSLSVPLQVSAAGEDYLSYHAQPLALIHNQPLPPAPVELLMVSNSPERLLSQGLWFEGSLADAQSARLLFHHVNGSGAPADLVVEIWNLGTEAARVHLIEGIGGPTRDESWAGHRAAVEFLGNRARSLGWIVPIAPGTAAPVLSRHISPSATASGLMEIRALDPADLRVRLYLAPTRSERTPHPIDQYSPTPFPGKWQYPNPTRDLEARYVVGRDWAFITIGDQAAPGLVEGDRLAGNYGVIYNITLELVNPTDQEAPVAILLEPAGGPARGFLLIDGRPVEAAVLTRDSEAELARYLLPPGQYRRVHIQTTPQSGSHYPVRLVARPI